MAFQLVQGINVDNIGNVHSAYFADNNGICAVLSADVIGDIVSELTEKLCGPVFFFLEIPCSSEEEKQLRKNKNDPAPFSTGSPAQAPPAKKAERTAPPLRISPAPLPDSERFRRRQARWKRRTALPARKT